MAKGCTRNVFYSTFPRNRTSFSRKFCPIFLIGTARTFLFLDHCSAVQSTFWDSDNFNFKLPWSASWHPSRFMQPWRRVGLGRRRTCNPAQSHSPSSQAAEAARERSSDASDAGGARRDRRPRSLSRPVPLCCRPHADCLATWGRHEEGAGNVSDPWALKASPSLGAIVGCQEGRKKGACGGFFKNFLTAAEASARWTGCHGS